MHLERYENNGLELLINTIDGSVFGSQSAIARMSNKNPREGAFRRFIAQFEPKKAEVLTDKGIRHCLIYSEDVILESLKKYNPALLIQCSRAGLRVYLYQLAGYKIEVKDSMSDIKILQACVNQLMGSMIELHNKIDNQQKELQFLKPIAERTQRMEEALQFLPEIEKLLQDISEDIKNNPNQRYKTLKQWLDHKGLPNLGSGVNRSMGRMVADFFKLGKLEQVANHQFRTQNKYPESFVPVITKAYQFMLFNR